MVYYTAITLKLNTKPWVTVTSRENYMEQVNYLCKKYDCTIFNGVAWELDKCCQLHFHGTLKSDKALFRKTICSDYRNTFKKHNIWLVPIEIDKKYLNNLKNWQEYCSKTANEEAKYHWLCRYYNNNYNEYNNEQNIRANKQFNLSDIILNKQNHWEKLQADFID